MDINELRACGYWGEREGRAAVALWRRSGEPLAVFARRVGLARSRLSYWARRIGSAATPSFVPVTVVASAAKRGLISIELRSGRIVRLEGDVDDATLERVILIAERAGC
jgi:hypothetical protein